MSLNTLNRYKYSRAAIAQAVKVLKTGSGPSPSFIRAHPKAFQAKGTKLYQGKRLVVPVEEKEPLLRKLLYENKNNYPFGRDSLFHVLKKEFLGLSKRDVEAFLNKQQVIVARRSRPKEEKREFATRIRRAGVLQGDLAHILPQDVPDDFLPDPQLVGKHTEYKPGVSMKNVWKRTSKEIYFYNLVDRFTGYLVTEVVLTKKAGTKANKVKNQKATQGIIANATKRLVAKMAKALGVPGLKQGKNSPQPGIKMVQFDQGTEFNESVKLLQAGGIKTKRMRTNAIVEQTNAKMQRIFYTLVAQKRAGFKATVAQAVDIANNTLNRRIKVTPAEAVKSLRLGEEVKRQKEPLKNPGAIKKRAFKVGTKVRALLEKRAKVKSGFKTYKGKHFGPVQTITGVRFYQGYPKYTLNNVKHTKMKQVTPLREALAAVRREMRQAQGAAKQKLKDKILPLQDKIAIARRGAVSKLAWHDQLIRARDADKISKDLVAGRAVVFDVKPKKKKKWKNPNVPKHAQRQRARFRVGQPVWYHKSKKRFDAEITQLNPKNLRAAIRFKDRGRWHDAINIPYVYLQPKGVKPKVVSLI